MINYLLIVPSNLLSMVLSIIVIIVKSNFIWDWFVNAVLSDRGGHCNDYVSKFVRKRGVHAFKFLLQLYRPNCHHFNVRFCCEIFISIILNFAYFPICCRSLVRQLWGWPPLKPFIIYWRYFVLLNSDQRYNVYHDCVKL